MRWIFRKAMLAVIGILAVRLVEYFMTDTGRPGALARSHR